MQRCFSERIWSRPAGVSSLPCWMSGKLFRREPFRIIPPAPGGRRKPVNFWNGTAANGAGDDATTNGHLTPALSPSDGERESPPVPCEGVDWNFIRSQCPFVI